MPARAAGIPYVYQVQDWWAPCARTNLLLTRSRALCPGPGPGECARCLPLTGLAPAGALQPRCSTAGAGALLRRALRDAAAVVMGSRFIADCYRALGWLPEDGS